MSGNRRGSVSRWAAQQGTESLDALLLCLWLTKDRGLHVHALEKLGCHPPAGVTVCKGQRRNDPYV